VAGAGVGVVLAEGVGSGSSGAVITSGSGCAHAPSIAAIATIALAASRRLWVVRIAGFLSREAPPRTH
jgi:hypothetical protein